MGATRRRALMREPWLSPMVAIRYATTAIQACVRGFQARDRGGEKQLTKSSSSRVLRRKQAESSLLDRYLAAMSAQEACAKEGLSGWCCVRIQAWARMVLTLRWTPARWCRSGVYQIAALQVQGAWREYRLTRRIEEKSRGRGARTPEEAAALVMQDLWRRYSNTRIFRYYRDLIKFRLIGDPAALLKTINPSEARLLDKASGVHLRFRLGGGSFPPMMYYKLFLHRPLVDINAFAPRDYTTSRPPLVVPDDDEGQQVQFKVGATYFGAVVHNVGRDGTKNWYRRADHNHWRPITLNILCDVEPPPPSLLGASQVSEHKSKLVAKGKQWHFLYSVRVEERRRRRKVKKRKWLQRIYKEGLAREAKAMPDADFIGCGSGSPAGDRIDLLLDTEPALVPATAEPKRDEASLDDVADILAWTKELDYDHYIANWSSLATSGPPRR